MSKKRYDLPTIDRWDFVLSHVRGRRVLDIGYLNVPRTEMKIQKGILLHHEILKEAYEVVGLDLHPPREEWGVTSKWLAYDVCDREWTTCCPGLWSRLDVAVMGEVLEHLENPGLALRNVREVTDRLVVTVPNAFSEEAYRRAERNLERVNDEHTAWYSPTTLTGLLERCGWKVRTMALAISVNPPTAKRLNRLFRGITAPILMCDAVRV